MKNLFRWQFRLLLLLLAGLPFAQTQAASLQEILSTNSGLVKITSKRAGTALYDSGEKGRAMRLKTKASNFNNTADWNQLWIIAANGAGYSVRNASTGNYINEGGAAGSGKYTFYINAHEGDFFVFGQEANKYPEGNKYLNESNGATTTWSIDDGSLWTIEAVSSVTPEQIRANMDAVGNFSAPADGKIYEVVSSAYGHCLTENFTSNNYVGQERFNTASQYFRIVKSGDNEYAFQNIASSRYVQGNPGQSQNFTPGSNPVHFAVVRGGTFDNYYTIAPKGASQGWHEASSQGNRLVQWSTDTDASYWKFREVTLTEEQIAEAQAEYEELARINNNTATIYGVMKNFFEDAACSKLKAEYQSMSDATLRTEMAALPTVLQDEVLKIKNSTWANAYEKDFRIAQYGAYSDAGRGQGVMRLSNQLGLINNPTGVIADGGDYVFIIVGSDIPAGTSLKVEGRVGYNTGWGPEQNIQLRKGLNFVTCENNNTHFYINYISPQDAVIADVPKLDIHVVGGRVNGYFDKAKHTDADWVGMQAAGLFQDKVMDILGTYTQLHVQAAGIKQYNPTKLIRLVDEFDWYCYTELEIMGLTAMPDSMKDVPGAAETYADLFPRVYNNHMLCVSDENSGSMYAGGNKICLGDAYMSSTYNYESIKNRGGETWAPAHEYGHQMQSAIHLAASTEVSNNFFSNVMLYKGGTCTSRGWNLQNMQAQFKANTHNWAHICVGDIWLATQMYYQLYLYYHAAGNDPLFYQKFFKLLREEPMQNGAGNCSGTNDYLHFARKACDAANENLTDFFEYWGFFEPVDNVTMASYSTWYMTTTQAEINKVKRAIASPLRKYDQGNPAMIFIDDRVVASYKADGTTQKDAFGGNEYPVSKCKTELPGAQYDQMVASADPKRTISSEPFAASGPIRFTEEQLEGAAGALLRDADGKIIYAFSDDRLAFLGEMSSLRSKIHSIELCYSSGDVLVFYDKETLDDMIASGIDDVVVTDGINGTAKACYDLTGRKVENPVKGQIYIIGGKKVIY